MTFIASDVIQCMTTNTEKHPPADRKIKHIHWELGNTAKCYSKASRLSSVEIHLASIVDTLKVVRSL